MSEAHSVSATGAARPDGPRAAIAQGIGKGLRLAATPTFAGMALFASGVDGRGMETLCSAGPMSPLSGMVPMYLLMSAFHSPPWLKLMFDR
jgi:hypothetical protein